jgi:hypothetical protein
MVVGETALQDVSEGEIGVGIVIPRIGIVFSRDT